MASSTNERINTSDSSILFGDSISIPQAVIECIILLVKCIWLLIESLLKIFIPATEKPVKGEITVITGAGHGIGRELALQYAAKGATVVCLDINKENNDKTVKEIAELKYPKAYGYVCDVVKREEVLEIAKQIEKEVGNVSILINNAGVLHSLKLLDSSPEIIQRTMNINVIAHFWTIQAFLPKMLELNHGHIVSISSAAGLVGTKYLVPYCTSKFAVRGMLEALRQELKVNPKCNVKTTTIFPHIVDTGLCKKPTIRVPQIFPMVKPNDAAKHIISAQRRNIEEASIPSTLLGVNAFTRLFPNAIGEALHKFVDIYVQPDL